MTTPFHDLDDYLALGRLTSLTVSPDGERVVVGRQVLDAEGTGFVTSLWEVSPDGVSPARRLTRGTRGESGAAFTSAGDLLFIAARAEAGTSESDAKPCLWRIPSAGGEAHVLARRPAGISGVLAAERGETVLVTADTLLGATDEARERELRKARKESKVGAILHTGYPVRYWDHDLGPAYPRVFAVEGAPLPPEAAEGKKTVPAAAAADAAAPAGPETVPPGTPGPDDERGTRDLTPQAAAALAPSPEVSLSADGSIAVVTWHVPEERASQRSTLVVIEAATGAQRVLVDRGPGGGDVSSPAISPDGTRVAFLEESRSTPHEAPRTTAWVIDLDGAGERMLAPDWDRWPSSLAWLPAGDALLTVADDGGRAPIFRLPSAPGAGAADVVRLTGEGAYSAVQVTPDGAAAFALRASYESPNEVVRLDLTAEPGDGAVSVLQGPDERPELPGRLTEISTQVTDPGGTSVDVRGFLALPEGASPEHPAPLLAWIHGGPLGSWNAWSWRWNPWLLVARGYAVLLPDPALSTGYGQAFVQRGWGAWGAAPFTDIMALTDEAERNAAIDATRTAAMGGSFGGYMANWVAGHTRRFRAIVTHASLWALDQFGPTTDAAFYWAREMTPEMAQENSPHLHVGSIATPMLVVHGDKDYRVPIGEGLRLWRELLADSALPADSEGHSPHQFLYFPSENHWVLSPQHAKVWYQVVEAFLAEHVLGERVELPEVLGGALG